MRHGRARRGRVERVAEPVVAVAADRRVDRAAPRPRPAHDEREVLAGQRTAPDESLQPLVGLVRARDDEKPRGVPVDAVDDPGPVLLPALGACGRECLRERAARVTGCRVHDDAGGLVHDEEVLVGVGDRELGRLDVRLRLGRHRRLDLELFPAGELVALAASPPVHEHGAGREKPLGGAARPDVRQPGEIAVEPLSRGLAAGRAASALAPQCRDARGSRSARTSAASRIPTPITMKLSARLNAGQ